MYPALTQHQEILSNKCLPPDEPSVSKQVHEEGTAEIKIKLGLTKVNLLVCIVGLHNFQQFPTHCQYVLFQYIPPLS